VILDDEPDRIGAMLSCVARLCQEHKAAVFDNAPDMIAWLTDHCRDAALLCLDHDLGPLRIRNGGSFDPGTGRDVADFLSTCAPVCPVIVHTTNYLAAPGMIRVLEESGWTTTQVTPYSDLDWISEVWIHEVCRVLRA
jgi:hypothetical protein